MTYGSEIGECKVKSVMGREPSPVVPNMSIVIKSVTLTEKLQLAKAVSDIPTNCSYLFVKF